MVVVDGVVALRWVAAVDALRWIAAVFVELLFVVVVVFVPS